MPVLPNPLSRVAVLTTLLVFLISFAQLSLWADPLKETQEIIAERNLTPAMRSTAGYIILLIKGKQKEAFKAIDTSEKLQKQILASEILKNLQKTAGDINAVDCVGYEMYSTSVTSMVFIVNSPSNPITIKMNLHSVQGKGKLKGIELYNDWENMEKTVKSVKRFPATMTITVDMAKKGLESV